MFYNLHNLLKIKSEIEVLPSFFLSNKFEKETKVDVEIKQSSKIPKIDGKFKCGLKYMGGDDSLLFFSDFKFFKFWISVKGLLSKKLEIIYSKNAEKIYDIEKLANWFIRCKLLQRKVTLIHSAAFSDENNGYLITSLPDTGKTTSILLLSKEGFNIIGDDICLLSKDRKIYMYIDKLSIFPYPKNLKFIKEKKMFEILKFFSKFIISQIPWINLKIHPNIKVKINRVGTPQKTAKIKKIFILSKNSGIEKKISPEEGIRMLFSSSRNFYVPYNGFCEVFWNAFCWFNEIFPHYYEVESLKTLSALKKCEFYLIGSKDSRKFYKKILKYV